MKIKDQVDKIKSFEDELNPEKRLRRKMIALCLDPSFLHHVLKNRIDLLEEILDWIKPTGEELAVEIFITQQQLHKLFQ